MEAALLDGPEDSVAESAGVDRELLVEGLFVFADSLWELYQSKPLAVISFKRVATMLSTTEP